MLFQNALASLAVKDLNLAIKWYETLFGKPADSRPMPEVAEWSFERGGWLQVYQLPERAGCGSVTLTVSNLEEVVAKLENMGVNTGERSSSEKLEILMITDPDGNHLALVEPIDPNLAQ